MRCEGIAFLHTAGQEAFVMISASKAFLRPKFLLFPVFASVLGACWPSTRPDRGEWALCDEVLRTPKNPKIRGVGSSPASLPDLPCLGGALCLDGNPRVWALRNVNESHLHTAEGAVFTLPSQRRDAVPAKSRIPGLLPHGTAILWLDGDQVHLFDWGAKEQATFPMPSLAPGEELIGGMVAEGRWGLLVQEGEACGLPRVRWLSAGNSKVGAAAQLPTGTPVAIYGGSLQGHLSRQDGTWLWHHLRADAPVALQWEHPTPPHVLQTQSLLVYGAEEQFWVHRGAESPREIRLHPRRHISRIGEHILIRDEQIGIFQVERDKDVPISSLRLHTDLAGAQLPAQTRREHIFWAHDENEMLLIIERIRLSDCRVDDRVHRLQLSTRQWETVASGPGFRMHPTRTGNQFRFVEASATYRFVGGGRGPGD